MRRLHSIFIFHFLILLLAMGCEETTKNSVPSYKVKKGKFTTSVVETGELEAVNARTISAPNIPWNLGSLKISMLVEDGKQVVKGDVVVDFGKNEVQKNLEDARANLDIAQAELRKEEATQALEMDELRIDLKKQKINYEISQLELESIAFEADIAQKEKQLNVERAKLSMEKKRQEIDSKEKVNREELNQLRLKVNQEEANVAEAEATLSKLTLRAPADGIAIIGKNWSSDNKFQRDDEVWRGQRLIELPDLDLLQAKVEINEVDISKIDTTQSARIRLDSFPDSSFAGYVKDISVLARLKKEDSDVKVFDVTVILTEKDTTFMPGMTVRCEILVKEYPDTLFVPREAIFNSSGQVLVHLQKDGSFEPRAVETGAENDDYVIVTSGLEPGDVIALVDPFPEKPPELTAEK